MQSCTIASAPSPLLPAELEAASAAGANMALKASSRAWPWWP